MQKHERAVRRIINEAGITLLVFSNTGKHLAFSVANAHGTVRKLFTSKTPSDFRTLRNFRGECRRFANSN